MSFFFLRDFLHSLASVVTCFSIFVNNREYIFSLFLCFFFTDYSRFFSILFVLQLPPSRISSSLLQIFTDIFSLQFRYLSLFLFGSLRSSALSPCISLSLSKYTTSISFLLFSHLLSYLSHFFNFESATVYLCYTNPNYIKIQFS